jgi:hypothetical protein
MITVKQKPQKVLKTQQVNTWCRSGMYKVYVGGQIENLANFFTSQFIAFSLLICRLSTPSHIYLLLAVPTAVHSTALIFSHAFKIFHLTLLLSSFCRAPGS